MWVIKKFQGGSEHTLRTRITLSSPAGSTLRKEVGPVSLSFEIPMYNVSNLQVGPGAGGVSFWRRRLESIAPRPARPLQVRYLRIAETHKDYKPQRWVR